MKTKFIIICALCLSLGVGCGEDDEENKKQDDEETLLSGDTADILFQGMLLTSLNNNFNNTQAVSSVRLTNLIVEGAELNQVFNPAWTSYQATAPAAATTVKITAIPEKLSYSVRLNGVLIVPGQTYAMPLNSNSESFTIFVLDPNTGSNSSYVLIVNRM